MKKPNVGRGLSDDLAIQLEYEPQNAMRGRMRRPHIEHNLLADVILARFAQCGVGRGDTRDRVR